MNEENQNTLFMLKPAKFSIPGQSTNGTEPLPDLEFERDPLIPGRYHAKIDDPTFGAKCGNGLKIMQPRTGTPL